jgi:mycothiol S-conjugate amidase
MPTALALHAHPDDESSKGAGTMARLADAGLRCVLVCATGGEAGDVLNPAMDHPGVLERLTELRREELAAAAAIIGYGEVIHLGYRDSGMPGSADNRNPRAFVNAALDEALLRVVEIVRRERPDVVFGYDSHSRYPHPDHLKVHELTVAVSEAAADPAWYPEAGPEWTIPLVVAPTFTSRRALALHEAMEARGLDSPLAGRVADLPPDAHEPDDLVRVNVAGFVARARRALRAHRTQVDPNGQWFAVPRAVVEVAYPYEDFVVISAPGGAVAVDGVFESWDGWPLSPMP